MVIQGGLFSVGVPAVRRDHTAARHTGQPLPPPAEGGVAEQNAKQRRIRARSAAALFARCRNAPAGPQRPDAAAHRRGRLKRQTVPPGAGFGTPCGRRRRNIRRADLQGRVLRQQIVPAAPMQADGERACLNFPRKGGGRSGKAVFRVLNGSSSARIVSAWFLNNLPPGSTPRPENLWRDRAWQG